MKRQLMTGLFAALAFTAVAQSNEWRDPEVNAVNRAPMHANFFAYETAEVAAKDAKEQSQNFMTLNGPWKFFWVKNADARPTDFWRTDYNDKGWNNMPLSVHACRPCSRKDRCLSGYSCAWQSVLPPPPRQTGGNSA